LIVVISWAIDASEGFAALSWLGSALDWSTSTHLAPFERGILALGDLAWLLLLAMGAVGAAWVGVRFDLSPRRRVGILAVVLAGAALACSFVRKDQHGVDLTEGQRASLPPGVIRALRALPLQLTLEVWLDRDDARRRQLESDALAKLRLARPDLVVRWPTDTRQSPAESERELGYGRIVVRANRHARETYSTSRRELVALIFEAAGEPPPDFTQHEYPGFPMVIEGKRRSLIASTAYFGVPSGLLVLGWFCTQPGRRKT
jgi:hypothetical protein